MPSRPATAVSVLVNGAPDPALRVHSVFRGTGGALKDQATIEVDLSSQGNGAGWIQDTVLSSLAGARIEVWQYPGGVPELIHSGTAVAPSIKIGGEERLTFTSRVEPWHFGAVMNGIIAYDPLSDELVTILDSCVFNPQIDGEVLPNQSQIPRQYGLASVMLDPESCRTPAALAVQGDEPVFWTLQSAAAYLCWALNGEQLYVLNPVGYGLLPDWPLQNFTLERGKFLCDYLDELLPRFGLTWGLDLSSGAPMIAFVVRGLGNLNSVYLGPPGALYAGDNAIETDVDYDVGNTRNQAVVQGDWAYYESTFPLAKGWAEDDDDAAESSLTRDSDDFNNPDNNYRDVWRKWVLNEAGDYCGTRPEIDAPYDLAALVGHAAAPRRRQFLPTLTLDNDLAPVGRVNGLDVEYSIDSGTTWLPIDRLEDHTCQILDRECGVLFDGLLPPAELRRAGDKAQVRVTATIRDDQRLGVVIGPDASSPLAAAAPFYLDESQKFHFREVLGSSKYFALVASNKLKSAQADDTDALEAYAAWLQQVFDVADVHGRLIVEGLDNGAYQLGDLITAVLGRNIDLCAQSPASGEGRYPQVVGITYDCQAQRRTLSIETFRDEGLVARWKKRAKREEE